MAPGNAARIYASVVVSITPATDLTIFNQSYALFFVDGSGNEYQFTGTFLGLTGGTPEAATVSSGAAILIENGPINPFNGYPDGLFPPVGTLNQGGTLRLKGNAPSSPPTITGTLVAMIYDQGILVTPFWNVTSFFDTAFASGYSGAFIGPTAASSVTTTEDTNRFDTGSLQIQLITTHIEGRADTSPSPTPTMALSADWIDVITRTAGDLFVCLGMYTGAFSGVIPVTYTHTGVVMMRFDVSGAMGAVDIGGFTIAPVGLGAIASGSTPVRHGRSFAQLV